MTEPERPSAEEMLQRVHAEGERARRGKLEVYFGAAPGVGKTFAMLRAGQEAKRRGIDVVVGVVETHGRRDTETLLQGLERLALREVDHRGVRVGEFDLDSALARRPALLLVDELAHTNAPGSRHAKRWQDVLEVLEAGIDVLSTLNVQHVESLNDVVSQITGVRVRETVPDAFLEEAAEIRLVDLAPDELLQRLRDGKVYLGAQAQRAIENFFKKGNLIALRELALRLTAARVDAQMLDYRKAHGIQNPWPAGEKVLVCVGPAPQSAGLVRAARRVADALRAPWFAVTVATPASRTLGEADRDRLDAHLRLAESLGAQAVTLGGDDIAAEVVAFARRENVTKIVCGKPTPRAFAVRFRPSVVEAIVERARGMDVYLPQIEDERAGDATVRARPFRARLRSYLAALAVVAAGTAIAWVLRDVLSLADIAMGSLLGIVVVALRLGFGPSLLASVTTILCYDFFFVPPTLTFAVEDLKHVLTFGVMLFVGVVMSTLASRLQRLVERGREQTLRLQILHAQSRDLAAAGDGEEVARICVRHVLATGVPACAWLRVSGGNARVVAAAGKPFAEDPKELSVAAWVNGSGRPAGRSTQTLAGAAALHLPIPGIAGPVGVLAVVLPEDRRSGMADHVALLEQMASQAALAAERANLADDARRALIEAESERLRASLLDSVSHDLRTPLASIHGASGALLDDAGTLAEPARRELLETIHAEAERLTRFVANLLDVTRIEAGALRPNLDWHSVEELVGTAIAAARPCLHDHLVTTELAPGLPLLRIDEVLVRQVLVNLLDNAAKHSPPGSTITIAAERAGAECVLTVADRGEGFPPGTEERAFEKFFRARPGGTGVGLGLTLARGIVEAHGGTIRAENRDGGGAQVSFRLPIPVAPHFVAEEPSP